MTLRSSPCDTRFPTLVPPAWIRNTYASRPQYVLPDPCERRGKRDAYRSTFLVRVSFRISTLRSFSRSIAVRTQNKNPAQYLLPIEQWSRDYRVPSYLADPLQKPEAMDGDAHCKLCPMQKGPKRSMLMTDIGHLLTPYNSPNNTLPDA